MGQYADFFGLNSTDLTWVVEDNCAGTFCFADLGTPYNLSVRLRWFFFFFSYRSTFGVRIRGFTDRLKALKIKLTGRENIVKSTTCSFSRIISSK